MQDMYDMKAQILVYLIWYILFVVCCPHSCAVYKIQQRCYETAARSMDTVIFFMSKKNK